MAIMAPKGAVVPLVLPSPMAPRTFFDAYLSYTEETENPKLFHRWCSIVGIGAFLGRQFFFEHGHFTVYPNMYTMLMGAPGTRKSTAIKIMKKLMVDAGYDTIAADRTTKEKFMLDLAGDHNDGDGISQDHDILSENLFGKESVPTTPRECFICADEFNDFLGTGNIEFLSLLGTLWDYSGTYSNRIKNGRSVDIVDPTISILSGNTPTGFALAFPTEIIGQGFFSRMLLVYGEATGKRITFPTPPSTEDTRCLVQWLTEIKQKVVGKAALSGDAEKLLDRIYKTWAGIDDVRFGNYSNRRFQHLLKLCLICAAARISKEISIDDVIHANTVLTHTEHLMPKALGEFGKAKHSDAAHKIVQVLETALRPMSPKDIWKHVHSDLDKMDQMADILRGLIAADKIMHINGGYLPKKKIVEEVDDGTVDYNWLTDEERRFSV